MPEPEYVRPKDVEAFDRAFAFVIKWEGSEYEDVAGDPGSSTLAKGGLTYTPSARGLGSSTSK